MRTHSKSSKRVSLCKKLSCGEGTMLAVLGMASKELDKILEMNNKKYECFIANDNSTSQVVVSGLKKDINCQMIWTKIKNLKLNEVPLSLQIYENSIWKMTSYINDLKMNDLEKADSVKTLQPTKPIHQRN